MKHTRTLLIFGLTLVALMVVGITGFSADPAPASGCGQSCGSSCGAPAAPKAAPAVELNLTSVQKLKIANIEKERDAKLAGLRARLSAKSLSVAKLVADPKTSRETIKKAVYEKSMAQADVSLTTIFAQREKDKVLTPAQKTMTSKAGSCKCGCGSK